MPAGECLGAAMLADAVARRLKGLTHLWVFTDSAATKSAITSGSSSGAPQLDYLVTWLGRSHPSVQFLGVHIPGVRNVVADKLSRGRSAEVLAEVADAGLASERLYPAPDLARVIRHVASLEHR